MVDSDVRGLGVLTFATVEGKADPVTSHPPPETL